MTYLRVPHVCPTPWPDVHGTLWRCDDCGSIWRASVPGNPYYAGWRRLGPIGRWLRGVTTGRKEKRSDAGT